MDDDEDDRVLSPDDVDRYAGSISNLLREAKRLSEAHRDERNRRIVAENRAAHLEELLTLADMTVDQRRVFLEYLSDIRSNARAVQHSTTGLAALLRGPDA